MLKGFALGLSVGALTVWAVSCSGGPPPSAKTQLAGQVIFSHEKFEDAGTFASAEEYRDEFKVTNVVNMTPPTTTFKYYASFREPLGTKTYYTQVYDTSETDPSKAAMPIVAQVHDVKSSAMTQVTSGWTFDIPEWPPPTDREIMEQVWVQPGKTYRVVILKPVAAGEFTVSAEAGEMVDGMPDEGAEDGEPG